MATSPLLRLARDSILEVLQAENSINREALLQKYPILHQKGATQVALYIDDEMFHYATSLTKSRTLLEDIIFNAKSAAFFGKRVLSTSAYLHTQVEVALLTFDESSKAFENESFLAYLNSHDHGIILMNNEKEIHLPSHINASNIDHFLADTDLELNVLSFRVYTLEKARDSAILGEEYNV